MSPQPQAVTVRMYNVGFGDAFLLLIPHPGRPRRVLVDCGTIKQGEAGPIGDIVEAIIADTRDDDGVSRIDVVVATHRHKDHVSGFADSRWGDVEVQEVWMPWTEHPTDPDARRIRDVQSGLALRLHAALLAANGDPALVALADNALSNEDAMLTLHEGFAGQPERRFLPPPERENCTFAVDALPGVTVHVLGPSRKDEVISLMDPPVGESYLRLMESATDEDGAPREPFSGDWTVDPAALPSVTLTDEDRRIIREAGEGSEGDVAAALDGAVNGTSLMLVLRIGRIHLLLPGDAQWGTWRAALDDPEWRTLLGKTTFLKVGHHGSHNATPKEFVEDVLPPAPIEKLWAMVSTIKRGDWPIPKKPLLDALTVRTDKLVRSDQLDAAQPAVFTVSGDVWVEATISV